MTVRKHAGTVTVSKTPGMDWWAEKTQVPAKVWEALGCYEEGSGVRFTFEGEDYYKVRKRPKEIAWVGTEEGEAPPLWPLPANNLPKHISIWEGESDCGTAKHLGLPHPFAATKGAKGTLPPGAFEALKERGVETVTVGGDADRSGDEFRSRYSREAIAAGLTCYVVRLDTILDPFSGINDLNAVWRACSSKKQCLELLERATQPVATRIPFRTVDEMEEIAEEEIEWLLPDLIAPGDKIMLAAPQKSLKSWLALELTRSLTCGLPFLRRVEWTPTRTAKIGFVQEEGSPSLWARRVSMLGISGNTNAHFSHRTGFRFTEPSYTDELISSARDLGLEMLILDPLQRMMPGVDSNSDSEVGIVWDEVFRIQQALPHLVVMIVHHANKTSRLEWESIRGSSRHAGEVDLGLFLERANEENTLKMWMDGRDIPQYLGTGEYFEVKYTIDRHERIFEMDATEIQVTTPRAVSNKNKEAVHEAVKQGFDTRTKLMKECDMADNTVLKHLAALVEEGKVEEHDNGIGKAKTYSAKESDETTV